MSAQRIAPALLEALICPQARTPLRFDADKSELINDALRLAYPVNDGVPIMIVEEARELDASE